MSTPIPYVDPYPIACALGADLAEDEIQANMGEMLIEQSTTKARAVRERCEAKGGWISDAPVDREYRNARRSIYGAVYELLNGYKGWRLVSQEDTDACDPHHRRLLRAINEAGLDGGERTSDAIETLDRYLAARSALAEQYPV